MTPVTFWKTTPRKFGALCRIHAELNDPEATKKKKKEEVMYIDQVSGL